MFSDLDPFPIKAQVVVGLSAKDLPANQFFYGFIGAIVRPGMVLYGSLDFAAGPPIVSSFMVGQNN